MSIHRMMTGIATTVSMCLALAVPATATPPRGLPHAAPPRVPATTPARPSQRPIRPSGGFSGNSSDPRYLAPHGDFVYFGAYTPTSNDALWRSDGSLGQTESIYDDVSPSYLTWAGDQLFFAGYDGSHGEEVWVSNGTHDGTHMVVDSVLGQDGLNMYDVTPVGDRVFFQAHDGVHGYEPWVSDGTPGGTHMARNIMSGDRDSNPYWFTALGDIAIFTAADNSHGYEVWRSDGTPSGTKMLKDIQAGPQSSNPQSLLRLGDQVIFEADDGTHGAEPWVTDGTTAGTHLLKDIAHGTLGSVAALDVGVFARLGADAYFAANDGSHNVELWKTDGTPGGTRLAADMWPGAHAGFPYSAGVGKNGLYIAAQDATHGYELWKSKGTGATTSFVKDIWPGKQSSFPYLYNEAAERLENKFLFIADDGQHGYEPWITNGTPGGTKLLKDIEAGAESSGPWELVGVDTPIGRRVFFSAGDDVHGEELWWSDGTTGGTNVIDIYQ